MHVHSPNHFHLFCNRSKPVLLYNNNYTDNYKFRFGFVAGNSEFRGQQTIQCYVGTQGGKADDGKTSIGEIKYTKLNKIGELTIYSPIES